MKTMIEVQYQEKNVKNGDLDKYVKETLKEQGVKTTEVETLNIYYLPETAKVFFVAIKKDGSELKGELDVNAMPEYPEVVKKTAANPDDKLVQLKSLEALKEVANGDANKIFIPFEATSALSSLGAITDVMKNEKEDKKTTKK